MRRGSGYWLVSSGDAGEAALQLVYGLLFTVYGCLLSRVWSLESRVRGGLLCSLSRVEGRGSDVFFGAAEVDVEFVEVLKEDAQR